MRDLKDGEKEFNSDKSIGYHDKFVCAFGRYIVRSKYNSCINKSKKHNDDVNNKFSHMMSESFSSHIFNCYAYVIYNTQKRTKLDPKSEKCIFLNYFDNVKGYTL